MDFETLKAIVNAGGGWDKVACLVFDNSQLYVNQGEDSDLKEENFVSMGGTMCYKELVLARDKKTYEYTVEFYAYHPLDHLQVVIMGDTKNADVMSINDMAGH